MVATARARGYTKRQGTTPRKQIEAAEDVRRATLAAYADAVGQSASESFRQFIDRQAVIFTEQAEVAALLEQQETVLPSEVVGALNDTERFWRGIDDEFGLLSSTRVAELTGARSNRSYASDQRRKGRLLALRRLNRNVFPGFQFDADGAIRPVIAELRTLGQAHGMDERDVIVWLCRPTTYFPGPDERPVDHIDEPDRLLEVAAAAWDVVW